MVKYIIVGVCLWIIIWYGLSKMTFGGLALEGVMPAIFATVVVGLSTAAMIVDSRKTRE